MHKLTERKKTALAHFHANRLADALAIYDACLRKQGDDPELWYMRGLVSGKQGEYARAADSFSHVVYLQPGNVEAMIKLATALRFMGHREQAVDVYRRALRIQPDSVMAIEGLAYLLFELGNKEESAALFRKALQAQPDKAEAYSVYGSVLHSLGLEEEAFSAYKQASQINPDLFLLTPMGNVLQSQGRIEEACEYYRQAVSRRPGEASIGSALLMATNYHPALGQQETFRVHREWGEEFGKPESRLCEHLNPPVAAKRLRIGYVSPDFRAGHSVTYFIEPLLRKHNKRDFEIFCYSMMPRPDETTARLRAYSDHWCDIHGWNDRKVADQIVTDKIDILVDLAGHSANNSLAAFALKPAPLQVTWLGYPNTTGLTAIDYRLTDAVSDLPGAEAFYTEHLYRLPGSFLCYQPPADAPPPGALPAASAGYLTFASFNNLAKVNRGVVELWAGVMKALPDSRLVLKYRALEDPAVRARYQGMFADCGIDSGRITLLGHIESRQEHLALYGSVDIALDTFPYNGTTTSCEALWMGVPVATLVGESHAGRVGASLLAAAGLPDWVAHSRDMFVTMLCRHAEDVRQLTTLRAGLRNRLLRSRLCDATVFTSSIEVAYRDMWQGWCDGHSADNC